MGKYFFKRPKHLKKLQNTQKVPFWTNCQLLPSDAPVTTPPLSIVDLVSCKRIGVGERKFIFETTNEIIRFGTRLDNGNFERFLEADFGLPLKSHIVDLDDRGWN